MTDEELIVDLNRLFWLLEEDRQYCSRTDTVKFAARRIEAQAAEIERLMKERDAAVHLARMRKAYIEEARDERDAFEAKLAKAVRLLRQHCYPLDMSDEDAATLADLTGAKP